MESPHWRHLLRSSFDYDLFANKIWLRHLDNVGTEEEIRVFQHILGATQIWLSRVAGVHESEMPRVPQTVDALVELHSLWCHRLNQIEYHQVVAYRNLRGEPYQRNFGDIARHVVNHGTYHRGQLRGMMGARGEEFPDTDFIFFTFEIEP